MSRSAGRKAGRRVLGSLGRTAVSGAPELADLQRRGPGAGTRSSLACYVVVDRVLVRAETAVSFEPTGAGLRGPEGSGEMARSVRSTATKEAKGTAVAVPQKARESDWALRIAKAKEAREAAKVARKGKRATFSTRLVP